jgi:hypothetical protein
MHNLAGASASILIRRQQVGSMALTPPSTPPNGAAAVNIDTTPEKKVQEEGNCGACVCAWGVSICECRAEKSKPQQRRVELADGTEQAQRHWESTQAELEQDGAIQPAGHRAAKAHVQRAAAPGHPGHHVSPMFNFHLTVM